MADDTAKGPPTIKFGDGPPIEIVDPGIPTVITDAIIEARDTGSGTFQIGFATLRATGTKPTRVEFLVCTRLRMTHGTAIDLHRMLGEMLQPQVPKGETH